MKYSSKIHMSYGLGGFLDNFFTGAFAIRVIAFYETEILLGVGLISLAFVLYGVWNMFNDPLAGYLSDKKTRFTRRWGRRYPWFIISAIPFTFTYLLIFTVPSPEALASFFWLLVTICLFDLLYSWWFTNWLAIFPDKFRSVEERTRVGGYSTFFGQLGLTLGMLVPPLFISYGNLDSYVISALVVLGIGLSSVFLMIPGMKEDKEQKQRAIRILEEEQESFFETLKFALKQKNFLIYVFTYLTQMILFMLVLGSIPYWVPYILGMEPEVEIYISAAFLGGSVVSVPLWMYIGRKLGNRKAYIIGSGITALSFIPIMFISSLLLTIVGTALLGITVSAIWTLMYPTFSDVIDEFVVKTGKRKEGVYTGIRTFFGRSSNIIGAGVIAAIHIATGFDPDVITPLAQFGIRTIMALIPMAFYAVSCILMWKVYDLTPDKVSKIQKMLKEKEL